MKSILKASPEEQKKFLEDLCGMHNQNNFKRTTAYKAYDIRKIIKKRVLSEKLVKEIVNIIVSDPEETLRENIEIQKEHIRGTLFNVVFRLYKDINDITLLSIYNNLEEVELLLGKEHYEKEDK